MTLAVYPGTFDPLTNGHLDIVSKAVRLFDEVVVAVLHNPDKHPLFTLEERIALIQPSVTHFENVRVASFTGLLADYAGILHATAIVRGLRSVSDFESEMPMAHMNARLNEESLTVFLPTTPKFQDISSSLVKQVALHGGNLSTVVPNHIASALQGKFA